jgi:hypothetical protein
MILAIDLAGRNTGWALMDESAVYSDGVIRMRSLKGYHWIHMAYNRYMALPWEEVDVLLVEFPGAWLRASRRTSTRTVEVMYTARAVLLLTALSQPQDIEIHEINPNEWQPEMLVGSPLGNKETAIAIAAEETGSLCHSEHDADAICMGLWWIRKRELDAI